MFDVVLTTLKIKLGVLILLNFKSKSKMDLFGITFVLFVLKISAGKGYYTIKFVGNQGNFESNQFLVLKKHVI